MPRLVKHAPRQLLGHAGPTDLIRIPGFEHWRFRPRGHDIVPRDDDYLRQLFLRFFRAATPSLRTSQPDESNHCPTDLSVVAKPDHMEPEFWHLHDYAVAFRPITSYLLSCGNRPLTT